MFGIYLSCIYWSHVILMTSGLYGNERGLDSATGCLSQKNMSGSYFYPKPQESIKNVRNYLSLKENGAYFCIYIPSFGNIVLFTAMPIKQF